MKEILFDPFILTLVSFAGMVVFSILLSLLYIVFEDEGGKE